MTDEREELRYLPLTLKQWKKLYGAKAINNSWRSIGPRPPEHHTDAECLCLRAEVERLRKELEGQRNIGLMAAGLGGERRPTPKKEAQK